MKVKNLFAFPVSQKAEPSQEQVESIAGGSCRIERILSCGQASPSGFWYDQEQDEWVALLQGRACLQWEDGSQTELAPGDWLVIPARRKHRVEWTSREPVCVWLTVHGELFLEGSEKDS
jgi:cupin 2 domain-containing protein